VFSASTGALFETKDGFLVAKSSIYLKSGHVYLTSDAFLGTSKGFFDTSIPFFVTSIAFDASPRGVFVTSNATWVTEKVFVGAKSAPLDQRAASIPFELNPPLNHD
jgi:hypothetical protein